MLLMPINWSVHLFIVHIKQHGCKHDSLGEACFGLWSGCSPITTPKRLGRFVTVLGGLDGHLGILLTQPRLSEVTSWSLPCMGELTFPSKVSFEEEFPLEKLGVIPWLTVVVFIWVSVTQSLSHFLLMLLTLFPEQWHLQNSNIYILLQLVWSFPLYVSLKDQLSGWLFLMIWLIHSNPREDWPGLQGPKSPSFYPSFKLFSELPF